MFAVPGWSVSADSLKPQVQTKHPNSEGNKEETKQNGKDQKSRKRKRNKDVEVTGENLEELWRKHFDAKSAKEPKSGKGLVSGVAETGTEPKQKKRRKDKPQAKEESAEAIGDTFKGFSDEDIALVSVKEVAPDAGKSKPENVPVNGHSIVEAERPKPKKDKVGKEDNKTKYDERKAKAQEKREQKALLQANGTLPPSRPSPTSQPATTIAPTKKQPKHTDLSEPTDGPSAAEIPATESAIEPHKAPEVPKITKASKQLKPQQEPPVSKTPLQSSKTLISPLKTSAPKLTPLQQKMAAKLTSARFRHLNQTLYTSPSDQAVRLFADSPQAYESYHAGFRAQVAVWPSNPVEGFVHDIKTRGAIRREGVGSQKKAFRDIKRGKKPKTEDDEYPTTSDAPTGDVEALPRSKGKCTIVDLGCGDANLAGTLAPLSSPGKLNLNIFSFDLAKGDTPHAKLITTADITDLSKAGVKDGSVDLAICCLSLMGTNWVDVVGECGRVVRGGGEVWIAEIKSRFARPGTQAKKPGNKIGEKKKSTGSKKASDGVEEDEEAVALEDLEAAKSGNDETDVSGFVEVFRKRGFWLKGEPDMANKMFVRMRFGKNIRHDVKHEGKEYRGGDGRMHPKAKFLDVEHDAEVEKADEGKVLKPCVYKTR